MMLMMVSDQKYFEVIDAVDDGQLSEELWGITPIKLMLLMMIMIRNTQR